ncbi:MAG: response regulator [Lentisphaeria bacterium]
MATPNTVLLVDDDQDFVEQQKMVLESAGYKIKTAFGQNEAEQKLADLKPDIALIDLMMEHADGGFSLCYKIKKQYPDVPVIIITSVASEASLDFDTSTEEERSWIKADAMLNKPVRPEQLIGTVEKVLSSKT